jgi:hypothetical protein
MSKLPSFITFHRVPQHRPLHSKTYHVTRTYTTQSPHNANLLRRRVGRVGYHQWSSGLDGNWGNRIPIDSDTSFTTSIPHELPGVGGISGLSPELLFQGATRSDVRQSATKEFETCRDTTGGKRAAVAAGVKADLCESVVGWYDIQGESGVEGRVGRRHAPSCRVGVGISGRD